MSKQLLYIIIGMALTCTFGACEEKEAPAEYSSNDYLKTDADVLIEASETSKAFAIESNCHWTIANNSTWAAISPTQGDGSGSVTISVGENHTLDELSGSFTITTSNGVSKQVSLRQRAGSAELQLSDSTHTFLSKGGDAWSFTITCNTSWTIGGTNVTGFSVTTSTGQLSGTGNATVTVTADTNDTESERRMLITIVAGTVRKSVEVRQEGGIRPELLSLRCTETGKNTATVSFAYESALPVTEYGICYSATTPEPTKNDPFLSQAGTEKSGTPVFTLSSLSSGTTYYVRAYAVNSVGIQYSTAITITTLSSWPENGDNVTPNI